MIGSLINCSTVCQALPCLLRLNDDPDTLYFEMGGSWFLSLAEFAVAQLVVFFSPDCLSVKISFICFWGARGLSGRVFIAGSRGGGFVLHRRHCVVFLSRTLYPRLKKVSTVSTEEEPSRHSLCSFISGPEVINRFSCSAQLSTKFQLLI